MSRLASRARVSGIGRNERRLDSVLVAASVLSNVGSVTCVPRVLVQSTVLRQLNTVLDEHIGVEKFAGLGLAAITGRVGACVNCLSFAGSGTLADIKGTILKDAVAEIALR